MADTDECLNECVGAAHVWSVGALAAVAVVVCLSVPLSELPVHLQAGRSGPFGVLLSQAPTADRLREFDNSITGSSRVGRVVMPWVRWVSATCFQKGTKYLLIGKQGWLFRREAFWHVVGDGFLRPLDRPGASASTDGEPLPAILDFRDALAEGGIEMILLLVPDKVTIHPETLVGTYSEERGPSVNQDLQSFIGLLTQEAVNVFDATPILWEARSTSPTPLYLPYDSHWTPQGMQLVAEALARHVLEGGYVAPRPSFSCRVAPATVRNRGDLYGEIGFPPFADRYCPVTEVTIRKVQVEGRSNGSPSEVLLLGDSFADIYSRLPGWGEAAGLPEQLALGIQTEVDAVVVHGGAVNVVRERLARNPGLLVGKRLVIWQITNRFLSTRPWKRLPVRVPSSGVVGAGNAPRA